MKISTFELDLTFLFSNFPLPWRTTLGRKQTLVMWPRAKLWMNSDIFAILIGFFNFTDRWINVKTIQRIFNPLAAQFLKERGNKYAWTLICFTVVFTTRNPAKTYRPRRTTVKGHACLRDVTSILQSQATVVTYLKVPSKRMKEILKQRHQYNAKNFSVIPTWW